MVIFILGMKKVNELRIIINLKDTFSTLKTNTVVTFATVMSKTRRDIWNRAIEI